VEVSAGGGAIVVPRVTQIVVTEDYFDTVGVKVLAGRVFREADMMAATAIVNETLAARLPDGALDGTIVVAPDRALRVIGIARNAKYLSGTEGAQPNVYELTAPDFHLSIIARAGGDPRPVLVDMQRALDGIGPGVQGFFPRTGPDHVGVDRLATDVGGAVARFVGGLALALSALALYGLVAWMVEMRRVEFGLRLALGATRADLGRLVLGHAFRSAAPGVLLGVPAAVGVGLLLRGSVAGVGAPSVGTIGIALAAMTCVIGVAAWLPARRAAPVDPVTLLRAD
jgi:ABC-type antimicrobial peptide transport system permease subunit